MSKCFISKTLAQWTNVRGKKKKKAKRLLLPPGGLWGNVTEKAESRGDQFLSTLYPRVNWARSTLDNKGEVQRAHSPPAPTLSRSRLGHSQCLLRWIRASGSARVDSRVAAEVLTASIRALRAAVRRGWEAAQFWQCQENMPLASPCSSLKTQGLDTQPQTHRIHF